MRIQPIRPSLVAFVAAPAFPISPPAVCLILILTLIPTLAAGAGSQPPAGEGPTAPPAPGAERRDPPQQEEGGSGSSGLAGLPEQWRSGFEEIDSHLVAGRLHAAAYAAGRLAERMARRFPESAAGRALMASALTLQAVARWRSGEQEQALWSWQLAQNLNPGLREATFGGSIGEVGNWLEAHRLRRPGVLDAPPTPAGAEVTPPAPLSVPPPRPPPELRQAWGSEPLEVEVVVDAEGKVRSPVVLGGGELPGKVYLGLAGLRQWRFRPALAGGEPTAALLRLEGLAPSGFAYAIARSPLGPVHQLLLKERWQSARVTAEALVALTLGCLADPQVAASRDPGETLEDHGLRALRQLEEEQPELFERFAAADRQRASRPDRRLFSTALLREVQILELAKGCDPGRPLVLRAVAEAALGQTEDALWSWHLAASFAPLPDPGDLAVYGPGPGRLLAERPCAAEPRACGAVALRDAPEITPPRAIATPPLRLPSNLAAQVGADRLVASLWIDAEGRVRGAEMRAGHSAAVGFMALEWVRDWRFEPPRRGGEPVAVVHDVSIPLVAAAAADQVARWRNEMDGLRQRLLAGDRRGAAEEARARVAEIAAAIGSGGSDLLAHAVFQLALAEAGPGLADEAVWHWHAAQNLAVEYRVADLSAFGAAGELLDRHRLRQPGEGAGAIPAPAPRRIAGSMPRFPEEVGTTGSTGDPDVATLEVIVDQNGIPRAPVVLGGRSPGRLFAALEAVREWRFEPAAHGGTAVPVLRRLSLPLATGCPAGGKMVRAPDVDKLVRRAVKAARRDPRLAGCYWRAAVSLEPGLATADSGSLAPAAAVLARSTAPQSSDRWSLGASPDGGRAGAGPGTSAADGDFEPPRKIATPQPEYTAEARRARLGGTVVAKLTIDEEGYVQGLEVLEGLPMGMNVEIAKALCGWRYEPATVAGEPVQFSSFVSLALSIQ